MFRKPSVRQAQKLETTLVIVGSAIAILGRWWDTVFLIGIILVLSAIIPDVLWNRCPYCEKHLGRNAGDYCQHCGKPLDEQK